MKQKYLLLSLLMFTLHITVAQNTWTQKSNFSGFARMGAVAFSIGTKGYLGTGGDFSSIYYNDFWEYDPAADSWTQKANFAGPAMYRAVGFSTDTKGYIGTGYNGSTTNALWEYDPILNSWTQKASMGFSGRLGAVGFVIGNKAYAGTGSGGGGYTKDLWQYNTVTNVWTQKADFGGNTKIYATGFSIGSKGYLGTGAEYGNIGIGTNDFWEYDTTSNSWAQKSDIPGEGRSEAVGFSIEGYGYIGTGTSDWGIGALADFWKYDPSADTWTAIVSYPDGEVEEATAMVIGCKGYVGTGFIDDNSSTLKSTFWEYSPMIGCSLAPLAALQTNDSAVCEVTCVDFTDQSTNSPTSWQWSFPGATPSSSTLQNPTDICYFTAGIYDVTLIVTNSAGADTIVMSSFINVTPAPVASITQSNDTLFSSPGNSYQWFDGGGVIVGATNMFYIPPSEGYYSVVITGSNGCTAADTIFYSLTPQTSFNAADTLICEKFCILFSNQSTNNATSWQWSFPGGNPSSSTQQNPPQICYDTPGDFNVMLITGNSFGYDTLTLTNYITVYATPPFPVITQVGYTLTSSVAAAYQWQFNAIDIAGATNQSYTVLQTGLYTVVISDPNGCVNSANQYVLITGIDDVMDDEDVYIYPNPSAGIFTIEWMRGQKVNEVTIETVNTLGQKVFSIYEKEISSEKTEVDLRGMASGVYYIEIKTEHEFVRKKIVIAH